LDFWIFHNTDNTERWIETNFLPKQAVFGYKKLIRNNFYGKLEAGMPHKPANFLPKEKIWITCG
jgi:hypothetical protein